MFKKTKIIAKFQEFIVKDYEIEDLKEIGIEIKTLTEILGPPLLCFLPGTRFYIACKKQFKNFDKIPTEDGRYNVLIHPDAVGVESKEPIFLSIQINFTSWCKPGKLINFPLVEQNGKYILDPFKTKQRMEGRKLPPLVIENKSQKIKDAFKKRVNRTLEQMRVMGLEKTDRYMELVKYEF